MPLATTITCLGTLLSEFAFDQAQQQAIPELLEISGTQIPAAYTRECTKQELSEGLEWLVATTQLQFFARLGERYHNQIPKWIEKNSADIIQISEKAGFLSEIKPQGKKVDCIAILGATGTEMEKRITYVKNLLDNKILDTDHIFLLTGERYALQSCNTDKDKCFIRQDGGMDHIETLATKNNISPELVTETHIMRDIYNRIIGLPKPYIIDTPKASKQRPDTFDTAINFIQSKEYSQCQHTAFVSRAPNIKAQSVAIQKAYTLQNLKTSFEIIGGAANKNELSDKTSAAYHILMPIAGTIYGNYLNVCKKISAFQNHCTEEFLAKNLAYKSLKDKQQNVKKFNAAEDL